MKYIVKESSDLREEAKLLNTVYIGLGSNIEPRKTYLDQAIDMLQAHNGIEVTAVSSIYETDPVDYLKQDDFLNLAAEIRTKLSSKELLKYCQEIEDQLGRKRLIDKGPRTIDLDILLYNDVQINEEGLQIPHPRLHERAFVLVPLNELAPAVIVANLNKQVEDILSDLPETEIKGVRKWAE